MINSSIIANAAEWSLMHGFALKTSAGAARHCPFSFTPTLISKARFQELQAAVPLFGKLLHHVSEDHDFIQQAITPLVGADPFFENLLSLHQQIHFDSSASALRHSLLMMRTDFMDDELTGPKLIEFNSIAAGMGPFGQRAHELHHYLQHQYPESFQQWSGGQSLTLVNNPAIERLSAGIAATAKSVRKEAGDSGKPVFMMIVQQDEDNVYDQHLLELALQEKGIRTVRRTFRELHDQLSTGDGQRLLLSDVGSIDVVYLRAGYQYCDYMANDVEEARCCDALTRTRAFIEQHKVAVNATVSQQLASSKRVQMLLSEMSPQALTRFGLTLEEAVQIKPYLGEMHPVSEQSLDWFKQQNPKDWVLKNQGEGGGHCVFNDDIEPKLASMDVQSFDAWALMKRLHPVHRTHPTLLVRDGIENKVTDLISEIGMFTIHFNGEPICDEQGYAGYLVRSKPASVTEGGVHSGQGVADSLAFQP